ncbi:hypothetical protein AAY473_024556 [Plecturocebus cupreus]
MPVNARKESFLAWLLSASDTNTLILAVSDSSQRSFNSISRRWRIAFASSRVLFLLISPGAQPNSERVLLAYCCNSCDNQMYLELASTGSTFATTWPALIECDTSLFTALPADPRRPQRQPSCHFCSNTCSVTLLPRGCMPASRSLPWNCSSSSS